MTFTGKRSALELTKGVYRISWYRIGRPHRSEYDTSTPFVGAWVTTAVQAASVGLLA
jgi:hypothetical protein